jgi:hypothetical protein
VRRPALLAAPLAIALAGCPRPRPETPPAIVACDAVQPAARKACRKPWTVLVYMAADDDGLPPEAYRDLEEMEVPFPEAGRSAASSARADVVVQLDLKDPPGIRRLHVLRADARPAEPPERRTPADIRSPVVEALPEETLPPEESVRRFLAWGMANYPSDHYWVVIWGHGLGWRPRNADGAPLQWSPQSLAGGIAFDASQRTALDIPSLRGALAAAGGGRPFDLFTADACLMQSLEVGVEIAGTARYLTGAEQIEDWVGLPYRDLVPLVNGGAIAPAAPACAADDEACRVAAAVPEIYRRSIEAAGPSATRAAFTMSALDASALAGTLHPAMHHLGAAIDAFVQERPMRAIDLALVLGTAKALPGFWGGTRDVGALLARLDAVVTQDSAIAGEPPTPAATRLLAAIVLTRGALRKTVIAASFGPRYREPRFAGMAGVSVWLPHDLEEYQRRGDFFASSSFYAAPSNEPAAWRPWIARVLTPPPTQP